MAPQQFSLQTVPRRREAYKRSVSQRPIFCWVQILSGAGGKQPPRDTFRLPA